MPSASAVVQISARGQQDSVLSGSPDYTIWKSTHSRFTSFACDDEILELSNTAWNTSTTATISRYGDLVNRITLEITLPPIEAPVIENATAAAAYYVNAVGFAIWESCSLEIGGAAVDEIYSDFAAIYEELAGRPGVRLGEAIGKVAYSTAADDDLIELAQKEQVLYTPIPFFFSKYQPMTYGLALPIVALSFHDIKFKLKTRSIADTTCVVYKESEGGAWQLSESSTPVNSSTGATLSPADLGLRLIVSYVYLDSSERNAMSSTSHSLVINTSQRQVLNIAAGVATKIENRLFFNHPASSLIWVLRPLSWNTAAGRRRFSVGFRDRYDYSHKMVAEDGEEVYTCGNSTDPLKTVSLTLNGHSRWPTDSDARFFRTHVPHTSWRTMPTSNIYSYAFGLSPAEWQPTSTLNFSRLDNVSLATTFADNIEQSELLVFVEAYNLLVINEGLGGLRFSN